MSSRKRSKDRKAWQSLKCFVEYDLLMYKGFCFFIYGAFGSFYPYLPLYFKTFGLTSFQAGTAIGVRPFIQIIGAPFWTTIGENFKAQRVVLFLGIAAWLAKGLVLMAIWPKQQECIEAYYNKTKNHTVILTSDLWAKGQSDSNSTWALIPNPVYNDSCRRRWPGIRQNSIFVENHPGKTRRDYFAYINKSTQAQDQIEAKTRKVYTPPENYHSRRLLEVTVINHAENQQKETTLVTAAYFSCVLNTYIYFTTRVNRLELATLFLIFIMVIIIGEFLESPTFAFSDASMLHRLGEDRGYYGQIRLWGAIGWAISTMLVGFLINYSRYMLCGIVRGNFLVAFYFYIGFVCVALYLSGWFKFGDKERSEGSELQKGLTALVSANHLSFLLSILYTGACNGFIFHFVNWYIDDRGGSTVVMGVAGVAREIGEFTFFLLGGMIVRFLGNVHAMSLCLLSYALCFYCYAGISSPWVAVPLELLDGATYSLAWSNAVNYMGSIGIKLGIVATMQGILQAVSYGLGNGGGTIIGGALYHHVGYRSTFYYFAFGALVVLGILLFCYPLTDSCNTGKSQSQREEISPSTPDEDQKAICLEDVESAPPLLE